MQLKEYQVHALAEVRNYFEQLAAWKRKAEENPDLEINFPDKAWEKAGIHRSYTSRKNGLGAPLPNFCLKVPTGGGKTLLAVKVIDLANMIYRRRRTGLVLWIVPTTQIYRQTIQHLKDKDHPYRQHLDLATAGRTKIVEKGDIFSTQDVVENLVVLMLMLPSANRKTKEVLRVFKDSGGFQDFFPPEDDVPAQEALLQRFPNLDAYERATGFWGRQAKTSLGNTLRMLSPLIILDEGHKAYSEGAQNTLRGFNPSMIVELSATPVESNVLVDISGQDLLREEMIKLDLHVVNKASPDWKDTLLDAHNRRCLLEQKTRDYEANTGTYIRPICLIQVERTGEDQRGGSHIHSEQVREHLNKVMAVPADQIAVKTSEKDELKEVDDVGGLMSRNCAVRYIITKQALQEGWDCAFAYVLAVLTNPSSKNAMTQLVGRILRQPFARKTGMRDLDESYVYCFQQRANRVLQSVREGFSQEGLGDLEGHIAADDESSGDGGPSDVRLFDITERFREAAARTILPVFVVRDKEGWRPVNYDMDIAARIPWREVDLTPFKSLTLSVVEDKDTEHVTTLAENVKDVIRQKEIRALREGAIKVDTVFITRQIGDVVPNPWQAHEFSRAVLDTLRKSVVNESQLANNFVFIIEELRKLLEREKERLAQGVFQRMLTTDELRFLIIGDDLSWRFPKQIAVAPGARKLTKKDGGQLEKTLFDFVPEEDFNQAEKDVAWYLDNQKRLFFWYRNRSRHDYSIQAWREHRIYPDFIFSTAETPDAKDCERVYVVETKGLHLKDNDKTQYIRRVFDICTKKAKSRNWTELGIEMKDRIIRFEVLMQDEWEAKLNKIFAES